MDGYQIKVFDRSGKLVDLPADAISVDCETVVNGGSGMGKIVFPRQWNSIGAIDHGYRFQVYLPGATDPWYDGRVMTIPRMMRAARGDITAGLEGWMTALNYGIVSEIISPGVQSNGVDNGQLDAGDYLTHLCTTYNPAPPAEVPVTVGFTGPNPIGLNLDSMQFDGMGLADVIDQVIKALADNIGRIYEWFVRGKADGTIQVVWRVDQNPNTTGGASFLYLSESDFIADSYQVVDDFTRIINMVAAYGGKDPYYQNTIWGPFSNSASITAYGLRQGKLNRPTAISQTTLNMFATAYLLQYANPTSVGQFDLRTPNALATAGQWVNINEVPGYTRQTKLTKVQLKIVGQRIKQTCFFGIQIPGIEKTVQGADPGNGYNAQRTLSSSTLGATVPGIVGSNGVVYGIQPNWSQSSLVVSYGAGIAIIQGAIVNVKAQTVTVAAGGNTVILSAAGVLSVVSSVGSVSVSPQPNQIACDDFTVNAATGKIGGWLPRAPQLASGMGIGKNLIPDSDIKYGFSYWTDNNGTASPLLTVANAAGQSGGNGFQYTGTGGVAPTTRRNSFPMPVQTGAKYTFSGYLDATHVTVGSIKWRVMNPSMTISYAELTMLAGQSGRQAVAFTAPATGTLVVTCTVFGATVANGTAVIFAEPMLQMGSLPTPYSPNTLDDMTNGFANSTPWGVVPLVPNYANIPQVSWSQVAGAGPTTDVITFTTPSKTVQRSDGYIFTIPALNWATNPLVNGDNYGFNFSYNVLLNAWMVNGSVTHANDAIYHNVTPTITQQLADSAADNMIPVLQGQVVVCLAAGGGSGGGGSGGGGHYGSCPSADTPILTRERGVIPAGYLQPGMHLPSPTIPGKWNKVHAVRLDHDEIWRYRVTDGEWIGVNCRHLCKLANGDWRLVTALKPGDQLAARRAGVTVEAVELRSKWDLYIAISCEDEEYELGITAGHNGGVTQ